MAQKESFSIDISCSQTVIDRFADFIELRFGAYLDSLMGFQFNLENCKQWQLQTAQDTKLSPEELDKRLLIRGNGPPSIGSEESRRREVHQMTQGSFKKNNSPGGENYNFAIENCLSDIFNYWKFVKQELGFKEIDDTCIFPITAYMRKLRNHVQHDLYGERAITPQGASISIKKTITQYPFPTFEGGITESCV